jgi:DNA-directed RNA polymerase specialized sigma24 family protein
MAIPSVFREVIRLEDLEDMSYKAIADILDVPVATVVSCIFRGGDPLRRRPAGAPA